jgi:SAM-dependent methyltransferase
MEPGEQLDRLVPAYGPDFKFHDENLAMLGWYVERMMATVVASGARSLLSLGIGHGVVGEAVLRGLAGRLERYVIVEGSAALVARFLADHDVPGQVHVVQALFEEFEPGRPVDAVEMGFVLEHAADPAALLGRYTSFLNPRGRMIVVVPNARSLHRLVGHAAGLLDDLYRLSPQDVALGHRRYFDRDSIRGLVEGAGLRVLREEGLFLKVLTTDQLRSLGLPPEVMRGFFEVGVVFPEIANAIYLECAR